MKSNPNKVPSDTFRIKSIQNAIYVIKKIEEEITLKNIEKLLDNTPGIGKGIYSRIKEILSTGSLSELDVSQIDLSELSSTTSTIHFKEAIGESTATKFIKQGITSLDALHKAVQEKKITVTHRVSLVLKYIYGKVKFKNQIPRKEMKKIDSKLNKHIQNFDNGKLEYIMCGSYRREKPFSNDIDILLFHPQDKKILPKFIRFLIEKGFIVDHLTNNITKLNTKYMGYSISLEPDVVRRVDIRLVDYRSKYTAIMYFTGSKEFNVIMRSNAKKKGYRLNEYCIEEIKSKSKIFPSSEMEIFKLLDMEYLTPRER
jgi:DNA polymerase/3'-5' exonuclease PolX